MEGAIQTNGILGVTRHIEHADVREQIDYSHGQFAAIHAGHNDIREQEIDHALMAGYDLQSGGAVFGFEDLVTLRFQILAGETAEIGFIFYEEDSRLPMIGAGKTEGILCSGGIFPAIDSRKIGTAGDIVLRLDVGQDKAAALFHDAIHHGKAEASALSTFGGEERLEDARLGFVVHANAGVADGKHDVVARGERRVSTSEVLVEGDVGSLDGELAALRDGIARINGKVHDDLVDLAGIGADRADCGAWNHDQIDILADHAGKHFQVLGNYLIQVEDLRGEHLFAAEGQQLPGQRRCALRGIGDFLRRTPQPGIGSDPFEKKLGIAGDHHQQVVEIVGDAPGEASNRLHLLRLTELQLEHAGLGNVFHEKFEAASFFAVWNRASGNASHNGRAILADALRSQVVEFLPGVKIIGGLKPLLGIGVQASQMSAGEIGGAVVTEHSHHCGVCVLEDAERVAAADAIRRVHHQRAKVALGAAEALLSSPEGGVEPADQQGHGEEQGEVRDGLAILAGSLSSGERIVGADGKRKRGGGESGLPSSVPGTDHHGDGEHDEAAFRDIGEKQGGNQRQDGAEESNSVAQDRSARGSYGQAADEGEFHSHGHMLCAERAQSELRQSTAVSWRHSGQRYNYQVHQPGIPAWHNLEANVEREKTKSLVHSLIS